MFYHCTTFLLARTFDTLYCTVHYSFNALTLMAGSQEGYLACKVSRTSNPQRFLEGLLGTRPMIWIITWSNLLK